jgi:hypothetical protein
MLPLSDGVAASDGIAPDQIGSDRNNAATAETETTAEPTTQRAEAAGVDSPVAPEPADEILVEEEHIVATDSVGEKDPAA